MRLRLFTFFAIAGLVTASCTSAEPKPPAETIPTTQPSITADAAGVEVAADFIKARDAWDSAAAVALLAPNAALDDFALTAEDYPDEYEFLRATDFRTTLGECQQTNTGDPAKVTCTYTYENTWTNAFGVGPYSGSSMDFVIADGLIQELDNNFDSSGFSDNAWDVFNSWIRLNRNADLFTMYTDGCCTPSRTPEAVVLWEQYSNEFGAELGAESSDPIATYNGSECVYEGPTEFALDSTVTFAFINESDTTDMGFGVWSVPEGTTADQILEVGIFEVVGGGPPVEEAPGFYSALFAPTAIGSTGILIVTLDTPGQHALNCFDLSSGGGEYAIMFTVRVN